MKANGLILASLVVLGAAALFNATKPSKPASMTVVGNDGMPWLVTEQRDRTLLVTEPSTGTDVLTYEVGRDRMRHMVETRTRDAALVARAVVSLGIVPL